MGSFTIETDLSAEVLAKKNQAVMKALKAIAMKAEKYAKESLTESGAVDTGRLRGSVTAEHDGNTVQVGTNVEYAKYVETGTSKMGARPYIKPAIADHVQEYQEIFKRILENA